MAEVQDFVISQVVVGGAADKVEAKEEAAAEPAASASSAASSAAGQNASSVAVPMSALAKKLPKPRPTGNSFKDLQAQREHRLFVDCINILSMRPDVRGDCKGFLDQAIAEKEKDELVSEDYFAEISTLGKLEEAWVLSWIVKTTGFSATDLGKAKLDDKDILVHLLEFLLNATRTLKLSEALQRKAIAARAFELRMVQAGNRKALLCGRTLMKNGQVNHFIFVYKLTFENEKASECTHRPTGDKTRIPQDVAITKEFDLMHNCSDMQAVVVLGSHHKYFLHKFFDKNCGPHKVKTSFGTCKTFDQVVTAAVEVQDRADRAAGQDTSLKGTTKVADDFHSPSKDVVRKRLSDARAKMRAKIDSGDGPSAKKQKASLQIRPSHD